jgi:hypothetical protein
MSPEEGAHITKLNDSYLRVSDSVIDSQGPHFFPLQGDHELRSRELGVRSQTGLFWG